MCSCCPLGRVATTPHTWSILIALRSKMTLARFAIKAMLEGRAPSDNVAPLCFGSCCGKMENPERY